MEKQGQRRVLDQGNLNAYFVVFTNKTTRMKKIIC